MSSVKHKEKIWNLISKIKIGMLVTENEGVIHARPMHLVQNDYDGKLWFFTDKESAKVYEIEKDKNVCVTFCDHENGIHVSLSGEARIDHNQVLIEKFWSPFVDVWFEEGKKDPNLTLLEIDIKSGEHWDAEGGKLLQFMEIIKAKVTGDRPDLGEHEKFGRV